MGHVRYLAFYFICGMGANALEILTAGAIAGVLAAYLVLYPTSRVRTLIPLGIVLLPARLPAWLFITGLALVKLFAQPDRVQQLQSYHARVFD